MNDSTTLRKSLAEKLRQRDAWEANEPAVLDRCKAAREELRALQSGADPAKASTLAKTTAKLRQQLAEDEAALQDARDIIDRLSTEVAELETELGLVNTLERRQAAARSAASLVHLGKSVDEAVEHLASLLKELRNRAAAARAATDAVLAEVYPDQTRLDDVCALIGPRAGAVGPEMGAAIAAMLQKLAASSGAPIEPHVVFNDYYPGSGTLASALTAGAEYVANRLGVQP